MERRDIPKQEFQPPTQKELWEFIDSLKVLKPEQRGKLFRESEKHAGIMEELVSAYNQGQAYKRGLVKNPSEAEQGAKIILEVIRDRVCSTDYERYG